MSVRTKKKKTHSRKYLLLSCIILQCIINALLDSGFSSKLSDTVRIQKIVQSMVLIELAENKIVK